MTFESNNIDSIDPKLSRTGTLCRKKGGRTAWAWGARRRAPLEWPPENLAPAPVLSRQGIHESVGRCSLQPGAFDFCAGVAASGLGRNQTAKRERERESDAHQSMILVVGLVSHGSQLTTNAPRDPRETESRIPTGRGASPYRKEQPPSIHLSIYPHKRGHQRNGYA